MNNRSSYLPNKNQKSNSLLSGKEQRATINPTSNKTLNHQQMIPKILQIMGKLENPTNTQTISKQTLRMATTNVFLDIMCILFRAIDGKFQRGDCTLDFISRAIELFGYKGPFNKTYFSPVGAPHTWPQLLAIVLFFAQLANFSYNFQSAFQERKYDQQQNSLILSSFQTRDDELLTKYIQSQVQRIQNQIKNTAYSIDSKKMAIRNLHIAQKDIATIEKQLKKEEELCYRTRQELLEAEGQIKKCEQAIGFKDQELNQTLEKQNASKTALEKLKYEIVHQELLPEQCEKLKIEIRDIKNRITSIDDQIYDSSQVQKKKNNHYLQIFNEQATKLRRMSQKLHLSILNQQSQAKLQLPTLSYQQFSDILTKNFHQKILNFQTQNNFESAIKQRQFSQYFRKLQQFTSRYENKFIKEEQDLLNYEKFIENIETKEKQCKENIDKIDKSKKTKKNKNAMQSESRNQIERNVNQLVNDISQIQQEFSQKTIEKDHLFNQTKTTLAELTTTKQQAEAVREQRQDILEKMRKKVADHKENWLNIITNYKQSIDNIFKVGCEKFQR